MVFILLGLCAGFFSGLIGIGGAMVLIPVFVLVFGYSQHLAQGTTLALMVPPIGLLAAWTYYKNGYVDVSVAILVCLGFFFGAFFGAQIANYLPSHVLRKIFGIIMIAASLRLIFMP